MFGFSKQKKGGWLTISFAFLTRLPRKPPPRVGEVVGSGFEVFSSQPPSPIIVLDAFLTVRAPWGRKGAKGVYAGSAPLDASSVVPGRRYSDALSEPRAEFLDSVYSLRMLACLGSWCFRRCRGLTHDEYRSPAES